MGIQWEDRFEQLDGLGETQLLHLARNESATVEYRLTAVEIMLKKGFAGVNHPDLAGLLARVQPEKVEVPEPVEVEHESELVEPGPFKASVTTETMFADNSVQIMDEDSLPANEATE